MVAEVCSIQEIVKLPQECSCGGKKGLVRMHRIEEVPSGKLLMQVSCERCGRRSLIPDDLSEQLRKLSKKLSKGKFQPAFYYDPDTGKIRHWSFKERR